MSSQKPKQGYKLVSTLFGKKQEIPEDWDWKKLEDLVKLSQGLQVPELNQSRKKITGLTRFLRIIDYTGNDEPRFIKDYSNGHFVKKEDIVMIRYGFAGRVHRGYEGVIANNLFKIIPKSSRLLKDFLFYFLNQKK